jgi:hypothetical protein
MSEKHQHNYAGKIFLVAVSAAVLVGSFVVGSQFVQQSMAQDLGQMGQQLGQQAKEKVGGAVGGLVGGNQSGNQTGNQSGGGMLGQLGEQAKSMLPGQ